MAGHGRPWCTGPRVANVPDFETDELRKRYALVVEGQCPYGCGELERREIAGLVGPVAVGWCTTSEMGWSIRGDEVTAYWMGFGQVCFVTSDVLSVTLGDELPAGSG